MWLFIWFFIWLIIWFSIWLIICGFLPGRSSTTCDLRHSSFSWPNAVIYYYNWQPCQICLELLATFFPMLFKWKIEALWGSSNRSNWALSRYEIFIIIFLKTIYVSLMKKSIPEITLALIHTKLLTHAH